MGSELPAVENPEATRKERRLMDESSAGAIICSWGARLGGEGFQAAAASIAAMSASDRPT